jgi:hypothetical protein
MRNRFYVCAVLERMVLGECNRKEKPASQQAFLFTELDRRET